MPSSTQQVIVVDASITVWAVLPGPLDTTFLFQSWGKQTLWAPEIWLPEVISAIQALTFSGRFTEREAAQAASDVFLLDVQIFPTDEQLAQDALRWARRLQQRRAYDAFYVALAQRLDAPFWSADKRLINSLHQMGASWAHWAGEGL
jgi:predicted nucleic acid-binding protein